MEPGERVAFFDVWAFPDEAFVTLPATKTLFVICCKSGKFDVVVMTIWAGFF